MEQKTVSQFDRYKDTYREAVQQSIAFIGTDVDFFTQSKVDHILSIGQRYFGDLGITKVLDVGCGVGSTDRFLVSHCRRISGVDVSEGSIETARRNNPTVQYQPYDGEHLPFPDESFDLVFAINVFHHVPPRKWEDFLHEMKRVVRREGIVMVFEHNPYNPLTRRAVRLCPFDADAVLLTQGTLTRLFEKADLRVLERKYILFFPWKHRILSWIEGTLKRVPMGAQHYLAGVRIEKPSVGSAPEEGEISQATGRLNPRRKNNAAIANEMASLRFHGPWSTCFPCASAVKSAATENAPGRR